MARKKVKVTFEERAQHHYAIFADGKHIGRIYATHGNCKRCPTCEQLIPGTAKIDGYVASLQNFLFGSHEKPVHRSNSEYSGSDGIVRRSLKILQKDITKIIQQEYSKLCLS